ncbi:MAG TPA: hypothetical protein VHA78_00795 [Candidatus Peribacteraceae bacterium]|nr:hypothetical protein [Candidatus Peribacteraceae bacterium]
MKKNKIVYYLLGYRRRFASAFWPTRIYSDEDGIYIGIFRKRFVPYRDFSVLLYRGGWLPASGSIIEQSTYVKHRLTFFSNKQAEIFMNNSKQGGAGYSSISRL